MVATLKDNLEKTREGYKAEGTWLRFLIDSYTGGGGFQGRIKQPCAGFWGAAANAYASYPIVKLLGDESVTTEENTYLDRFPREDPPKFQRRINVAHHLNYVKPTTNLKISFIMRKRHKRNNIPKKLEVWIESTGYNAGFRRRALVAAVFGWFPMVVDKPATPSDARNAAEAGNLDPYATLMLPCQLLDYLTDEFGQLVWAKTCLTVKKRERWDSDEVETKRYTIWTREDFTVYEVTGEVVNKTAEGKHPFLQVPIVFWRADTSVEDPVKADSINADVAMESRRLFNILSELDEHIRSQVFALLVMPSLGAAPEKIEVGTTNGIQIGAEQKNVPFYLSPDASVAATLENAITRTIVEIYRMARVEYTKASGANSSAQSKAEEFEQTNLAIADFAASLAVADRETLILVGRGLGIDEKELQRIECVAHENYGTDDLNEEIDQIVTVLTVRMLGQTFRKELLVRFAQRMLPNMSAETRKTIEDEINAAVKKDEQEAEVMKVAEAKAAADDPPAKDDEEEEQIEAE